MPWLTIFHLLFEYYLSLGIFVINAEIPYVSIYSLWLLTCIYDFLSSQYKQNNDWPFYCDLSKEKTRGTNANGQPKLFSHLILLWHFPNFSSETARKMSKQMKLHKEQKISYFSWAPTFLCGAFGNRKLVKATGSWNIFSQVLTYPPNKIYTGCNLKAKMAC